MARARPDRTFAERVVEEGVLDERGRRALDEEAIAAVDEAVKFADESPFPDLDSLYDDIYVFDEHVPAWWTVDERSPEAHRGERRAPGRRGPAPSWPSRAPPTRESSAGSASAATRTARASRAREPERGGDG